MLTAIADAYPWQVGVRVFLHPTQPALMLPQLQRDVQIDILVASGAAAAGLLHLTELRADKRLELLQMADNPTAPLLYDAAITTLARRAAPEAFLAFLGAPPPQAKPQLAASGLNAA